MDYIDTKRHRLAYRLTIGNSVPIVIPNGLGATLVTLGMLQDELTKAGFTVLTFDRPGVGFSPEPQRHPTVDDCIEDMKELMDKLLPGRKCILLGPSMGSIMCQCFMAAYPDMVAGFLNMDGLPHPFERVRDTFLKFAGSYQTVSSMVWTGLLRVGIFTMGSKFKRFETETFPANVIAAQMNARLMYDTIGREMVLMMDMAGRASLKWGNISVSKLKSHEVELLIRAPPRVNGTYADDWVSLKRSAEEHGDDWADQKDVVELQEKLCERDNSELGKLWRSGLPVRVMSARSYEGYGNSYSQLMRDLAAAEHSFHAVMTNNGARYTYPERRHDEMFLEVGGIVKCCKELKELIEQSQ